MSKTTHIIAILDRSGSMSSLASEVITNFNKFLKEQQAVPGKAKLTLATFDDEYRLVHDRVPLQEVQPITEAEYSIGGMTAMFDGVGKTLSKLQDKKRAIVFIHTDGHENASKEYTKEGVKKLVDGKKDDWQFIFVGADIDAASAGSGMGINIADTIQTTRSVGDLADTYSNFVSCSTAYRTEKM